MFIRSVAEIRDFGAACPYTMTQKILNIKATEATATGSGWLSQCHQYETEILYMIKRASL